MLQPLEFESKTLPRTVYIRSVHISAAFQRVIQEAAWLSVSEQLACGKVEMPPWFAIVLTRMVMKEWRLEIYALDAKTLCVHSEHPEIRESLHWLGVKPWDIHTATEMDPKYILKVPSKESRPPENMPSWLTLDG